MSSYNVMRVDGTVHGNIVALERTMAEDALPGHAVELTSGDEFKKHDNPGAPMTPFILRKDFGRGKTVHETVSEGSVGFAWVPQRGDTGWVRIAQDENVAIGDRLESAGEGEWEVYSAAQSSSQGYQSDNAKAMALEAVNLTDSSGAESANDYFCYVMFL